MKTRLGKIAQLPQSIRDQLNHRLQNGAQSPDLLQWLNDLPETKELLAAKFAGQPITKSNLSHWRHGGFLDWLQDQERAQRIQRLAESGVGPGENPAHLFANVVRFTLAELITDLDRLPKHHGQKRSEQLHHFIRGLARLQDSYNHTRRTDLAWTKYHDSHTGTGVSPVRSDPSSEPKTENATPSTSTAVAPDDTSSHHAPRHDPAAPESNQHPQTLFPIVYHTRCYEGCICSKCHAADSEYPLDEVLRDKKFLKEYGQDPRDRHGDFKHLIYSGCDCFCEYCAKKHPNNLPFAPEVIPSESASLSTTVPLLTRPPTLDSPITPEPPSPGPLSPLSPLPNLESKLESKLELARLAAHAHFLQKFGPRTPVRQTSD